MQKLESISAYRKSALQCLGYTVEEGDNILGRLGVGVVERISIVHFHPGVIQALFLQEEDHPPAAAESKSSSVRSGRKRKLDSGRIPYAIGQSLGMKENECHLSPTLDLAGMNTFFALPNYDLNHAAIDVADAVMKRDWGDLYCTSSNGSTMTTIGNPSLEEHHARTPANQVTTTNTPVHDEPSIELLKHDNIRLTIMYFQLVERYDQEVKARAACEQLAVSLQSKIDTLAPVLNGGSSNSKKSSNNSSTESRSRTNANVGGRKPTAKNLPTTIENLASNDSNTVSGLLQLLHNGKRSPPSRPDGELGPRTISDF
jgi:hypothetical protein